MIYFGSRIFFPEVLFLLEEDDVYNPILVRVGAFGSIRLKYTIKKLSLLR